MAGTTVIVPKITGYAAYDPTAIAITGGNTAYVLAKSFAAVSAPADTTEDILATITVPANALAANGAVRVKAIFNFTNSVGTKTMRIRFGGIGGTAQATPALSTHLSCILDVLIGNANATNAQVSNGTYSTNSGSVGTTQAGSGSGAVDTTASTTIVITGQKNTSGDTLTLVGYVCEVMQ